MKAIPSLAQLFMWESQLESTQKIAIGEFCIVTKIGNFSIDNIKNLIKLHKVKTVSEAVCKEIDGFNESMLKPLSVQNHPQVNQINQFKEMLLHNPAGTFLKDHRMTPNELSYLCCRRLLSCDHFLWLKHRLNQDQKDSLCIYLNYVRDKKVFVERNVDMCNPPKRLVLILNVGSRSGNTFLGSDLKPGCHWSFCIVEKDCSMIYCDSLGWNVPSELSQHVKELIKMIWEKLNIHL